MMRVAEIRRSTDLAEVIPRSTDSMAAVIPRSILLVAAIQHSTHLVEATLNFTDSTTGLRCME